MTGPDSINWIARARALPDAGIAKKAKMMPAAPSEPLSELDYGNFGKNGKMAGDPCKGECLVDWQERSAIVEIDGHITRRDAEALGALSAMPLPSGVDAETHSIVIDAAARFLERAGRHAAAKTEEKQQ
jgi:hypothetical protein